MRLATQLRMHRAMKLNPNRKLSYQSFFQKRSSSKKLRSFSFNTGCPLTDLDDSLHPIGPDCYMGVYAYEPSIYLPLVVR